MKIIVTGALGHIGSKLIRSLPEEFPECDIVMIDNMLTQRYSSLFNLPPEGKYTFLEQDINKIALEEMLDTGDVVIHLAAITNAADSFDKQEEIEEVNFVGTKKVADTCAVKGAKFIFLSTTSVYGTQEGLVSEACADEDLKPQSPYADSKLRSEKYLGSLSDRLQFVILRFGTICGYSIGMRFHTAVNKFCWQAVMRQPLTVWETAYQQKRPYLVLSDAVRTLIFVIQNNLFNGEIYNVLSNNYTVKEIVGMIKQNVETQTLQVGFVKSKIMNQLSYEVSNEKILNRGMCNFGSMEDSIAETIFALKHANGA